MSNILRNGFHIRDIIRSCFENFGISNFVATVSGFAAGLPDFSWSKHTELGKIYQLTTNYTKLP
jgi:hypothetical protein